ncbi:MAG: hypothetical protein MUF72_05290 [Elainella sp. Prado103]|nr:hypothetical protein [Elainella sp. Prado103]
MNQAHRFKLTLLGGLTLTVATAAVWRYSIAPQLFPQRTCVINQTAGVAVRGAEHECPVSHHPFKRTRIVG